MVLHPKRDSAEAVAAVLDWATRRNIQVLGIDTEISRLNCAAVGVTDAELGRRADLVVSLGGDGTMLRAMRLADRQRAPVLGVNLGKLGFLAEVDVPDLPSALTAVDAREFTVEPRMALDAIIGDQVVTAFNDIAVVRFPGHATARVSVLASGNPFVSYAADAIVVATPAGSTAYSSRPAAPSSAPRSRRCWSLPPPRTPPTTAGWCCRSTTASPWNCYRTAVSWPSRLTACWRHG